MPALVVFVAAEDVEPIPVNAETTNIFPAMVGELEFWFSD